jgi:hypothetical protein
MRRLARYLRARPGTVAIVALGIAWGMVIHTMGWAQLAHFAEVRALASGEKTIDRWHWETGDVAWIDGHYYSVKSPGLAALSTPLYALIDATGGRGLSADAADNAARAYEPRWMPNDGPPFASYGYDPQRAERVQERVEDETVVVWALTLLAAVAPSILLLLLVRWAAERLEPGYGTVAAITLGVATIVMVFAAEFFSHAISATLGFAAFCVLMRERAGPARTAAVALAGLLAGLAVTFEFQAGLVGVVLFGYAIARSRWPARAGAYAAGAFAGALPALAFNWWTLGSPFKLAYSHAVATIGASGHAELGLNSDGFFGITLPRWDATRDLLFAGRGVLVLTPILAMAVVGVFLMRRRHRAESWTIGALALAYFLYNAGYWQPFGGGTPGARFLMPLLPFLALGLAFAYRRLPATTLVLAVPSALWMLAASLTYPLVGEEGSGLWVDWLADGRVEHTLLTVLGVRANWIAALPVLAAVGLAIGFAAAATPRPATLARADVRAALLALGAWLLVSTFGPTLAHDPATPLDGSNSSFVLIGVGALAALAALAALRYRVSGPPAAEARPITGELALGERSS